MKLTTVKLRINDFSIEDRKLISDLGSILNPFFDSLILAINKNLTVNDNLPFEFITLKTKVNSNGIPIINSIISTNLKNVKGFICINAVNNDNSSSYINSTPFLTTEVNSNNITIKHISGLASNTNYTLTLLAIS